MRRKARKLIFYFLFSLFVIGCDLETTEEKDIYLTGQQKGTEMVKSLVERKLIKYSGGKEVEAWIYSSTGGLEEHTVTEYNATGFEISSYSPVRGNSLDENYNGKYVYIQDGDGNITRAELINSFGTLLWSYDATYDTAGNCETYTERDEEAGKVVEVRVTDYDSDGKYDKETYYSDEEKTIKVAEYTCDYEADGLKRPVEETKWYTVSKGSVINGDGENYESSIIYHFTYDTDSRPMHYLQESFTKGSKIPLDIIQYHFDVHNRKVKKSYFSSGKIQSSIVYTYDAGTTEETGLGSEIHYDENDRMVNKTLYTSYDEGNFQYYEEITYSYGEISRGISPSFTKDRLKRPPANHYSR